VFLFLSCSSGCMLVHVVLSWLSYRCLKKKQIKTRLIQNDELNVVSGIKSFA